MQMAKSNDSRNNMDHLDALELRLSNERIRLASATSPQERELRAVWVKQIEKEIGVARAEVREARHERRSGH
jgi:hypothetical protein